MNRKILIICIIIVLSFILLLFSKPSQIKQKNAIQTHNKPSISTIQPNDNPPVEYNVEQTKKMLDLVDHRRPLSSMDKQTRDKLVKLKNPLIDTTNFGIEYVSEPDEFMVEIRTINIKTAKDETIAWFQKKGLSQEGICHLPIVFYLNSDTAQNLRGIPLKFDPLPLGC
ncbi:MAG TPA: hypothetical protein VNW29_01145 [Candidatus Sulfotelmatobacter sp.]|jgi:hypothetical protein|nr:hypothetical protein [Candidatus Sulfotelmatobacter sp.]